jgi:type I restriction enzyme, S subunit
MPCQFPTHCVGNVKRANRSKRHLAMGEWKPYKLTEVIEKFIDYRGKTPAKTDSGIPLITAKVVKDGRILEANEFIAADKYKEWMTRGYPEINDVILTTEAPLGEVALLKDKNVALAQRIITLRGKKGLCDNAFLKYYFQSNVGQSLLQSRAQGSTVEGIKSAELKQLEIRLPEFPEQRAIASVLTSLDDKIDLLHRQSKTLEALAETLFRQWFVEEAEESLENGLTYKLGDLIDTISQTFKFMSDKVVFLNTSDIYGGQVINHALEAVASLPGQAKKSIKRNDILYSEIRPANKRYAFIDFDADNYVVSTKLMVLRAKANISPAIIYFYLTHPQTLGWLQMSAEGRSGTFPQITFDQVEEMRISLPTDEALNATTEWTESTLDKISKNNEQIRTLTTLRDTLLPKLMSGVATVSVD